MAVQRFSHNIPIAMAAPLMRYMAQNYLDKYRYHLFGVLTMGHENNFLIAYRTNRGTRTVNVYMTRQADDGPTGSWFMVHRTSNDRCLSYDDTKHGAVAFASIACHQLVDMRVPIASM